MMYLNNGTFLCRLTLTLFPPPFIPPSPTGGNVVVDR